MNAETLEELASAYADPWREHDRLLHYIELLEETPAQSDQLYYFESYVWTDVAEHSQTVRTAQRIRQQAVDELAKLYAFAKDYSRLNRLTSQKWGIRWQNCWMNTYSSTG